jgi:hypothetical protein
LTLKGCFELRAFDAAAAARRGDLDVIVLLAEFFFRVELDVRRQGWVMVDGVEGHAA